MLWRNTFASEVYDSCKPMPLTEGLLISHDFDKPVQYIRQAIYHKECYLGQTPLLDTNINLVIDTFVEDLPLVAASWHKYTHSSVSGGSFLFSVAPIVYSMATSAVITWFLTIFVITNYMIKPSLLLQTSVVAASIYMLITVIKSIVILHNQQRRGFFHGEVLLDTINSEIYLNVIDLFITFLLQVNQVQVIMRLFSRQSDKRIIFLVGLASSIASQTLWSISKFHSFGDTEEAGKTLPAFTYLIRISMSISYASIFSAFLISKIKTLMLYPNIWAISVLSLILIFTPVAFFIADVSSSWMFNLSEVFSTVTYVVCVVIPWEWCNKYNVIRKILEKEGVLGRKFYEDEMYELDKLELFVEEDSDDESFSGHSVDRSLLSRRTTRSDGLGRSTTSSSHAQPSKSEPPHNVSHKVANGFFFIRDGLVRATDYLIATGMAIPRSVSANSPIIAGSSRLRNSKNFYTTDVSAFQARSNTNASNRDVDRVSTERRGGEVFVYDTKGMNISLDDE